MLNFLYFLLIGLLAGWLAGQILKGGGFGIVGDLIVGVVGAVIGGFVLGLVGFSSHTLLSDLVSATIGAILLLLALRWFKAQGRLKV